VMGRCCGHPPDMPPAVVAAVGWAVNEGSQYLQSFVLSAGVVNPPPLVIY
jgi:hypothetical protein